jgi:hypothetical protein
MMNAHWIPWTDRVIFRGQPDQPARGSDVPLAGARQTQGRAGLWLGSSDRRALRAMSLGGGHGDAHLSEPYRS